MRKYKKYTLFLIIGLGILLAYYVYSVNNPNYGGTAPIFEIKDTKEVYNYPDSKVITIMKHYMITNPPSDLNELKAVVEKYNIENPIDPENQVDNNKTRHYEAYFYRKSKKLPVNWQPNEAYMNTDRIEHHKDDCIAVIRWTNKEPNKKIYDLMKKSSNKADLLIKALVSFYDKCTINKYYVLLSLISRPASN